MLSFKLFGIIAMAAAVCALILVCLQFAEISSYTTLWPAH